jgi:hypothetical protein
VIRRAVLEALAQAAEAGEGDDAALARLRIDPVLAGRARRALRSAVVEALIDAPGVEGVALVQRAYLVVAGQRATPDEQGEALAARFAAARAAAGPAPRVSYALTMVVAACGLLLLGGAGVLLWRAAHPGPKDAWHRRSAPPAGVLAAGGVPAKLAPEVAEVFQQHLVAFLLQLDRLSQARASDGGAAAAVIERQLETSASEVELRCAAALPEPVCTRLVALVAAARAVSGPEDEATEHAFLDAVGALDDALAAAGLAVYLDGDVLTEPDGRRLVILYSFAVERVHLRASGIHRVRALWLRRLDTLNFEQAASGFVRPNLREALVLLDQSENELAETVLPALVDGGVVRLSGEEDARYPGRAELETLAARTLAREWTAALGRDADGVRRVAARLVRREALLDQVSKQLERRNLYMARPTGLRLPGGWLAQLRDQVPHDTYDALAELDEELGSDAAAESFAAGRDLFAGLVETHEVQHRLDYASSGRRMPPELEAYVGPVLFEGQEQGGAASARDEMSAYLAQLARAPALAGTSLVLIGRALMNRHFWGGAECHGALVILAGLARELGLPEEKLVAQRFVDRGAAARTLTLLLGKPEGEVSAAAARLWQHLYGVPLEPLEPPCDPAADPACAQRSPR